MLEEDFLKEKQDIRQKMLKFSRNINHGTPLDDELRDEITSDMILRRRFKNKRRAMIDEFDEEELEQERKNSKKSNIYLKEDLINVKLEEKQSLTLKFLSHLKNKKNKRKQENIEKKNKKIFNFSLKNKENKNLKREISKKENNIPKIEEKSTSTVNANNTSNSTQISQKQNLSTDKTTHISNDNHSVFSNKNHISNPKLEESLKKIAPRIKAQFPNFKTQVKIANEEDSEKTKNVLLEGFTDATKEDRNLNFNHLLFAVLLVSFALFLFVPQIYIRNQIYYLSREIATLRAQESVLDEENRDLKRKLENMRFQNQILDYLE